MSRATATLEQAPQGALLLEDQAGNPVSLWHPDMEAFDSLSPNIRAFLSEMVNPPPAESPATVMVRGSHPEFTIQR